MDDSIAVELADVVVAALEAAGYTVAKLEQVGWLNPALTEPEDCPVGMARDTREYYEGYTVPVYRIVEGE